MTNAWDRTSGPAFAPYIEELPARNAVEEVASGLARSEGRAAVH
ncbi:hypothetical protein ACOZDZ_24555 [Streptomyces griseoincarnatus]|nr:hypothetical protein [Streptomyces sp. HNS054]WPW22487.1 hypothetical protein UBV09_29075 [Streptomyces griseoincarnatus]